MFTAPKQEAGFCQPKDNLITMFLRLETKKKTQAWVSVCFPGMTLLGIVKEKKVFKHQRGSADSLQLNSLHHHSQNRETEIKKKKLRRKLTQESLTAVTGNQRMLTGLESRHSKKHAKRAMQACKLAGDPVTLHYWISARQKHVTWQWVETASLQSCSTIQP